MHKLHDAYYKLFTTTDAAGFAVAVVLTFAFLFGVLLPLNARMKQQAVERQTAARESQRLAGIFATGKALEREIELTRLEIMAAPLQLSSVEALNQRLADLAQLANRCMLHTEQLTPDEAVKTARFVTVPVRMSGHGSYRNCAMFIHCLHQQLPDVDVRAFKLTGTPNDPATDGNFEFQLGWIATERGAESQISHLQTTAADE
jgi:Tfp pilus assembly protein PilO